MSDGRKGRAQAHQNKFAFKDNKGSKKSKYIKELPVCGLCHTCEQKIQWRKQYHKYKPLTALSKCNGCQEKKINQAYHTLCDPCATAKGVCAKCTTAKPKSLTKLAQDEKEKADAKAQSDLAFLSERARRSALRAQEKSTRKGGGGGSADEDEEDDEGSDVEDEGGSEAEGGGGGGGGGEASGGSAAALGSLNIGGAEGANNSEDGGGGGDDDDDDLFGSGDEGEAPKAT